MLYRNVYNSQRMLWGHRDHDRMIVGFITTYANSAYRH